MYIFFDRLRLRIWGCVGGEIAIEEIEEVKGGVLAFVDAVRAVGVGHHVEGFVVFDQFVYHRFGVLVMDIVVAGAMDNQ